MGTGEPDVGDGCGFDEQANAIKNIASRAVRMPAMIPLHAQAGYPPIVREQRLQARLHYLGCYRCQHHLDEVVQIATMRDATFAVGTGPK